MQNFKKLIPVLLIGTVLIFSITEAKTLFEDDFSQGLDKWELFPGQGEIEIGKGLPPEYGPHVLLVSSPSDNTLAFVKDFEFTDGIIDILWRDKEIGEGEVDDRDADGPLIARMQAMDFNNGCLLEFDKGDGLHFDILGGAGVLPPRGPESDGEWNWLRFRLEGELLQSTFWEPGQEEPEDWIIEAEDASYELGFVGLRAWSGTAEVAYFRVSDLDGPSFAVEPQEKITAIWARIKTDHLK